MSYSTGVLIERLDPRQKAPAVQIFTTSFRHSRNLAVFLLEPAFRAYGCNKLQVCEETQHALLATWSASRRSRVCHILWKPQQSLAQTNVMPERKRA